MTVRIPTDADIRTLIKATTEDGAYDSFTRDRVGGSTITATKMAVLTDSGRIDCCLCGRDMLSTTRDNVPELNHLVPATWANEGGWLVRGSALRMLGHAAMVVACRRCNRDAGDRVIWPSDMLHSDHYVTGCAPKPEGTRGNDAHVDARRERLGW